MKNLIHILKNLKPVLANLGKIVTVAGVTYITPSKLDDIAVGASLIEAATEMIKQGVQKHAANSASKTQTITALSNQIAEHEDEIRRGVNTLEALKKAL
jgi:uncharacterized coiled-coil protein SlyX